MLTVLDTKKSEKWDAIVRSFRDYDTYWLSGYVKAFRIHGDGEPLLFFYEDADVRGINVVMRRDVSCDIRFHGRIPKDSYFDFSTPYGYGGWLIEGEKREALFGAYEDWCRENGIISEFVRFHPMIRNHKSAAAFYEIKQLGEVVHMELSSPDSIWDNLTSKNRNMIRKAQRNGVQIKSGESAELYETFRQIYNATMDKDEAEKYYYFQPAFYDSVREDLQGNAKLFFAERDGQIIAASIMLIANSRMNYHLSGSVSEFNTYAPSNLMLYEAGMWGCAHGCKTLYLGGGVGSGTDSLFKFKRAFFKGDLHHFYIGKKVYDSKKYDELIRLRDKGITRDYFPLYRA